MKTIFKTAILASGLFLMAGINVQVTGGPADLAITVQWMSEAEALLGRQRRTRRRGIAVGYAAGAASATAAAPAPAPVPAPEPAAQPTGGPPLGSIVSFLPAGCSKITISNVQYNNCGGVYYRTAFQGNNLVYVVSQP